MNHGMNPVQQQLLDKLNKQNTQAGFDTSVSVTPPSQPTVSVENVKAPVQPVQPEPVVETLKQPMEPKDHIGEIPPAQPEAFVNTKPQEEVAVIQHAPNQTERIRALEEALGEGSTDTKSVTPKARAYLDDFGAETYYVQNISNGHVSVSDIDVTVKRGKSEDLLKFAELEDIKKSRDLRAAIGYDKKPNPYKKTLLLRLTPEQYEEEKTKELKNKQKINQFKQNQAVAHAQQQQLQQQPQTQNAMMQQRIAQPQTPRIRPTVLSKLEKLRLSSVPENAHLGMAPEEFVEWAVTEDLSIEELDFVISHPNVVNNPNIRTALYEKRSEIT